MQISDIDVTVCEKKIKNPYTLSFTTVLSFKCNIIKIILENEKVGFGEVTALPGYSSETYSQIHNNLLQIKYKLKSANLDKAESIIEKLHEKYPFSASAVGTAVDFAFSKIRLPTRFKIPILKTISSKSSSSEIKNFVKNCNNEGYRTVKVKIGQNLEDDVKAAKILLDTPYDTLFRFDANQGYSLKEALNFLNAIEKMKMEKVELLEQPLSKSDWRGMSHLCEKTSVPLMLDESIYSSKDIKRASDIGCNFIKLKLAKTKGVNHLIKLAIFAKKRGLGVILGNGVATDITNFAEAIAFISKEGGLFHGAFEGIGFLRMKEVILNKKMKAEDGYIIYNSTSSPNSNVD